MTAILYENVMYVDVNTDYGVDSDPELIVDTKDINNSLRNIFTCLVGTRANERDYGSYLMSQLFEPCDDETADDILFGLIQSVELWEPRVFVDRSGTSITPLDSGDGFSIVLAYYIKKNQKSAAYQFTAQRMSQG